MLNDITLPDEATIAAVTSGVAYYTYAIARRKPGAPPLEPIPGVDPRRPVRAVGDGELVALVSDVSLAEFDLSSLEQRLQDRTWLEFLAVGHQRVMEALLPGYTLLPLKLCTLYTDEARIHALLAEQGAQLAAQLERLEGANEWGVKVYCDRAALALWAEQGAPQLQKLAAQTAAASPGARYMLEKRLKRAAQEAAESLQRSESFAIARRLVAAAVASQRNKPQPAQIHGRGGEMTLNGAYLVDDAAFDAFAAELEALRAEYGLRGFTLELTGPWPPYSFGGDAAAEEA